MTKNKGFNFAACGSSGYRTNSYGNGSISFHFHSPGDKYVWTDLGNIDFTAPTKEQLESMETAPEYTEERNEYYTHKRRLSFKQADFLRETITKFLMEKFNGYFPSDEEINNIKQENTAVKSLL